MGRKNDRKKSSCSRKMRIEHKRLVSKRTRKAHEYEGRYRKQMNRFAADFALTPMRGEIWFADLGEHPGTSVQAGSRPVFVVSNDIGNAHAETVTVVPLTRKLKKMNQPTHVLVMAADCPNLEPSLALAEQMTTIDKGAFESRVGKLSEEKTREIESAIKVQLGLWMPSHKGAREA